MNVEIVFVSRAAKEGIAQRHFLRFSEVTPIPSLRMKNKLSF